MEYTVERISQSGLSMGKEKNVLAYGRLKWKDQTPSNFTVIVDETITEKEQIRHLNLVDLDVLSMVSIGSRKYKEARKELFKENKRKQFKDAHPVRWMIGELIKNNLL